MALLFMDGMDCYAVDSDITDRWSAVEATGAGDWTVQTTGGVNGGGALKCEQDDLHLRKQVRSSGTLDYMRVAFWFYSTGTAAATDSFVAYLDSGMTSWVGLGIKNDGTIVACGAKLTSSTLTSSVLATGTANICDSTWHFVEHYIKIAGVGSGRHKVIVDGVVDIDYTGNVESIYSFDPYIVEFYTNDTDGTYDDIIVWDDEAGDSFTGEFGVTYRIDTLFPSGNGDSSQFVGSDADSTDNYLLVDETALDTADYVGSPTTGNSDLYAFDNLSGTPSSVFAAVVSAQIAIDSAGAEGFRLNAKSSSTTTNGSDLVSDSVAYKLVQQAFTTDPATSTAWIGSGIDSAQFGIEKRST